jgi:hypothetical protein
MKIVKVAVILILSVIIHILFIYFIKTNLDPIRLTTTNLFIFDLLGISVNLGFLSILILEIANLIIITYISSKVFKKYFYIFLILFTISPWSAYLTAVGSIYIFCLFTLLLSTAGLILVKDKRLLGFVIFTIGSLLGIYTNPFFVFIAIAVITLSLILRLINIKDMKKPLTAIVLLTVPLIAVGVVRHTPTENIYRSQILLFKDPGLLNNVNEFQGFARSEGYYELAKISENRYLFSFYFAFNKFAKHLTPSTYFTQQEKLLTFSNSPPIYFGFVIPFLYGLYLSIKSKSVSKVLLLSFVLFIPSVLSRFPVDLNKLILVMPFVVGIVSYGIIKMWEKRNLVLSKIFLILTLILIVGQMALTLYDIQQREKERFIRYYGDNFLIQT